MSVADVLSPKSPVPVVKAKKMTAQELQAKQFMLKYNGSLSSPTSLPRKRKIVSPASSSHSTSSSPQKKKRKKSEVSSSHCSREPDSAHSNSSNSSGNQNQRENGTHKQDKHADQEKKHTAGKRGKYKKRKRMSDENGYVPSQEQKRESELSLEALSVATGLHLAPKPRQTRRSMQAVEALQEIKATASMNIDNVPNSIRHIYSDDIFTGKNLGSRLAEAFSVQESEAKAAKEEVRKGESAFPIVYILAAVVA